MGFVSSQRDDLMRFLLLLALALIPRTSPVGAGRAADGRGRGGGHHAAARLPDGRVLLRSRRGGDARPALRQGARLREGRREGRARVARPHHAPRAGSWRRRRKLIEKETGIPGKNVMISATHSHTGPVLWDGSPRARRPRRRHARSRRTTSKELPAKIAEAVKKADAARKPATVLVRAPARRRGWRSTAGSTWPTARSAGTPARRTRRSSAPPGRPTRRVPVVLFETRDKTPQADRDVRQLRHAPRHGRRAVLLRGLPVHALASRSPR